MEEDFRLDEYECTRIKGTIYFVDIPEEAVAPDVDTGMFFFYVGHTDAIYAMYRCTISGSGGRRIGGMFDFNADGNLDAFEQQAAFHTFLEDIRLDAGIDTSLDDMDDDMRADLIANSGIEPDGFGF